MNPFAGLAPRSRWARRPADRRSDVTRESEPQHGIEQAAEGGGTALVVPGAGIRAASRARFRALERLLEDDAPTVLHQVRREYERAGRPAVAALRRASRSERPQVRARARAILAGLERRRAVRRLVGYVRRERVDLETGLALLARCGDPRLDLRPYRRTLDLLGQEVARRGRQRSTPLERALVLCEYLGKELDYGGSVGDFHHPDNVHLHRAIERRAGMPLSLCAVYLFVARRAGIRAAVLPLPGHVMLRLYGGERSVIVDPYHKGQLRTERDCRRYLEQNGLAFQPAWLRDAPDAALLRRQVTNLQRSAQLRGARREEREWALLLRAIERSAPAGDRARRP